jgi:hypothetical protein
MPKKSNKQLLLKQADELLFYIAAFNELNDGAVEYMIEECISFFKKNFKYKFLTF